MLENKKKYYNYFIKQYEYKNRQSDNSPEFKNLIVLLYTQPEILKLKIAENYVQNATHSK